MKIQIRETEEAKMQYIRYKNPDGRQSGVRHIVLDGSPVEGCVIKATPGKHTVEVVM